MQPSPSAADSPSPHPGAGTHGVRRVPGVLWGLVAFACGLLLTGWLWGLQRRDRGMAEQAATRALADKAYFELQAKLRSTGLLVRAVQTLFLDGDLPDGARLTRAYGNLQPRRDFPSLLAFVYARRERRDGVDHYISRLVAPLQGNRSVEGLDVLSQPANLRALEASRDSNRIAMSGPFPLVQGPSGNDHGQGVIMRLPVYAGGEIPADLAGRRERLVGSIGVSFRIDGLIRDGFPPEALAGLRVSVADVTDGGMILLARLAPPGNLRTGDEPEAIIRRLTYGGRTWQLRMTRAGFAAPAQPLIASVVPAGVLASVLLGLLVWSLAGTRRRALEWGRQIGMRYRESEERFRTLNEVLPALVLLVDARTRIVTYANQTARDRFGDSLLGKPLAVLFDAAEPRLDRFLADGGSGSSELVLRDATGERFWASVAVTWLLIDGERQLVVAATDITEQRALTELLGYQASHDEMTGLINRREFERRLQRAATAVTGDGPVAAVLYVDLDQFKLVNDTSGHVAGDQLLIQLANLMRGELPDQHVVGRLGGDEFGVILLDLAGPDEALHWAEELRQRLESHVFQWEDRSYLVTVSVGGVVIDRGGMPVAELLAAADTACYMAKEQGRNRVHFFSEEDEASARRRGEMEWANRLRWAVQEQRFVLAYQEVHPLDRTDRLPRIELLLRFRDEDGRLVPPGAFLPAAERYGLMPAIDRWVIETALANVDRLHPAGAGLRAVAINLSGASIEDDALAEWILRLLQIHRVAADRVCFEITETVAVRQLTRVARLMASLRAAGCHVALDDFGVGMSSFNYLKHLPVDIIKIDGSFVRDMLGDPISHAMVRAVTDIGHRLGLLVVAEWVTDEAIRAELAGMGVDMAQGFALHRPELVVFQRDAALPDPA